LVFIQKYIQNSGEKEPGGKRPLGRPRFKRECNINVDLKDMGWEGVDWLTIWAGGGLLQTRC
jgi:hypothetical protein